MSSPRTQLSGFSNPAPFTIAALYVLAGAVGRTGILAPLAARVFDGSGSPTTSIWRMTVPATGERVVGDLETPPSYVGPRPAATASTMAEAEILASRSEVRHGEWDRFLAMGLNVVPMGSVAYKLALVAAGRSDATWTLVPKNEWDVAAGVALLRSAGAHQRRLDHAPIVLNAENTLLLTVHRDKQPSRR